MKIRFPTYLVLFAASLCFAAPSLAEAQTRERRVGVTISAYFNTDAEMAAAISEVVGRALTKTLKVQTFAGPEAQDKLPEAARSETCIGDSDCLIAAGQALGVDELLMLIVVGGGDELKIEATWASMDTGETALRPAIVVPVMLDDMERILAGQASSLIPGVDFREDAVPPETGGTGGTGGGTNLGVGSSTGSSTGGDLSTSRSAGGLSSLGKGLLIGGGLTVTAWAGYGIFRRIECGAFFECDEPINRDGTDTIVDIVGGVGTAALAVGAFMYFTSDSEQSPGASTRTVITPTINSQSLGFALGGQF